MVAIPSSLQSQSALPSNPWRTHESFWRRAQSTLVAWYRLCLPWSRDKSVLTSFTQTSGALTFAACMASVMLLDIALEVILFRFGSSSAAGVERGSRTLIWLVMLAELSAAAAVVDLATTLLSLVHAQTQTLDFAEEPIPKTQWSRLSTCRTVAYAASTWMILVIPLGFVLQTLPADLPVARYSHLLLVLPTAAAVVRITKLTTPEASWGDFRFALALFCLTFLGINMYVDRELPKLIATLASVAW